MSEKKRLRAVVIDGQGGGLGRQIVTVLRKEWDGTVLEITAVGTNSAATAAMHKAGADHAATGENAVIVAARRADVIIGPIGIVIADALWGEISPAMAVAVGQSAAKRILIPVNQCGNIVAGVSDLRISALLDAACDEIRALL